MYGIIIDFNNEVLRSEYPSSSYMDAHSDVRSILIDDFNFTWIQGDLYFGGDSVNSITCVVAVQELAKRFAWFSSSAQNIKMFRVDEFFDLGPAIGRGSVSKKRGRPMLKVA